MNEDRLESAAAGTGRQLGRRDFLKIAFGAGLVVVVEGCAPAPPPAAQPAAAPAAPTAPAATTAPTAAATAVAKPTAVPAAAPPKPTGTLTVAIPLIGNPAYIPSRIEVNSSAIGIASFGETLLERRKDRTLGPRLAESFSVSPDGNSLTFDLRKGIKFHDGSELTSADVKFTLEQVVRQDSVNSNVSVWRAALDRVETPTPQRAVLRLKNRNIGLPFGLAAPGSPTQLMFPKEYVERAGDNAAAQKPIGTGPWKFVEFKAGELVRFEAVENHWRQTPAFKELVIRQVPEESTRVAMVLRGEADLAQVTVGQAKRLQDGGANLFVDPTAYALFVSLQGQYLPSREKFDPKVPWAADPADKAAWERARKVREAMNLAIDRKAIIDTILAGQGTLTTYGYAVPGSPFEDPSWKPAPYDPARAKQLLAEAGYPNGFEFPLLLVEVSGRPGSPQMGEAVAQYWQAVGLRPKLSRADYAATVRPAIVARSLAGSAFSYANWTYDEPAIGHDGNFTSDADSLFGAEYPPLDDLVKKALQTADAQERIRIQRQMGKMVMDEQFMVSIAWVNALWGGSKRIRTFPRVAGVIGPYNFEYVVPGS